MTLGNTSASALRLAVSRLLRVDSAQRAQVEPCLIPMSAVELRVPAQIGNFTDFFTSIHHANNASRVFDPSKPELPNFRSLPIAYHGRASSIAISGTPCVRPQGQVKPHNEMVPTFGPSRLLDYELEVGFYISAGNARNHPVALSDTEQHVFGLCLVNDWSARDIQGWEMLPLGPFLAKSFMTTVSPWVVTLEALAPFRCAAADRGQATMPLLPYLHTESNHRYGGVNIELQVALQSHAMRTSGIAPVVLGAPRFADQYWTIFQMLAHHTSNGCNLQPGDLLASGTISGPNDRELGCMLELTSAGRNPVKLPNGESREFLQDGDEVIMSGRCHRADFASIGFGECRGLVTPSGQTGLPA